MRHGLLATLVSALLVLPGCGGSNTPPSSGGSSGGGDTISGRERFAWSQNAESPADLSIFRYALYVDNQRRVVDGETCMVSGGGTTAECSAPLPPLGAGRHTLELAAFFMAGDTVVEGARSPVLQVTVAGVMTPAGGHTVRGGALVSSDGVTLHADILATDLVEPVDLSVAPDGRVFVAERGGRMRIITESADLTRQDNLLADLGEPAAPDGAALLSIALTPAFASTGQLHIGYLTSERDQPVMRIVRMRESGGVLGQPAVIGSYPVAATDISALLRFSPDGKLYVGIGTGSNPRDAQDLAAPSGKILRLRDDGTTPDDNPTSSPVLSAGHRDPRGLVWLPQDQSLWEVERNEQGDELNRIHSGANYGWPLLEERQQNANAMAPVFVLRSGSEPSGMTTVVLPGSPLFGDLIVSTLAGRDLLRFRFTDALQPQLSGRLLQGRFGRIAQVASGTDGALYFVTANQEEWGMGQDVLVRVRPHTRRQPKPLN